MSEGKESAVLTSGVGVASAGAASPALLALVPGEGVYGWGSAAHGQIGDVGAGGRDIVQSLGKKARERLALCLDVFQRELLKHVGDLGDAVPEQDEDTNVSTSTPVTLGTEGTLAFFAPERAAGVPDPVFWKVMEYYRLGDWRHP